MHGEEIQEKSINEGDWEHRLGHNERRFMTLENPQAKNKMRCFINIKSDQIRNLKI